jgi:hypothetical protein
MRLKITSGKLDVQPHVITCQLRIGLTVIECCIEAEALHDLADHHSLIWRNALGAFSLLIPEIERIATEKYRLGRWAEDGKLLIGRTDLVRYGFSGRTNAVEPDWSDSWAVAAE